MSTRVWVQSLASLRGLRIQGCRELWWRSQTRLGSGVVAVVQTGSCSSHSDLTPSLGTSICCGFKLKKDQKKKKSPESEIQCIHQVEYSPGGPLESILRPSQCDGCHLPTGQLCIHFRLRFDDKIKSAHPATVAPAQMLVGICFVISFHPSALIP